MEDMYEDEILSIEYYGEIETIDISTDGNHLFFANDILTHNSAIENVDYDNSMISGGLSKINTADNVIGIFTSVSMRDSGRYQVQFMKTRSSAGVGSRVDLSFNVKTLRIEDLAEGADDAITASTKNIYESLKKKSIVNSEQKEITPASQSNTLSDASALRAFLKRKS